MISFEPPIGTRDMFPSDMRIRNWLFSIWRRVSISFNFLEYDAPVLESSDLFKRKSGEEIIKQMYTFTDNEQHEVCLRPEMTPSLARLVLSKIRTSSSQLTSRTIASSQIFPLKWFSIPQCWRFETTQRGRKREHFQWNMDIIGVKSIHAEAELISATITCFKELGLSSEQVKIKINSRKLLNKLLTRAINSEIDKEFFKQVCVLIDKLEKIGENALKEALINELNLSVNICDEIINLLSNKRISITECEDLNLLFNLLGENGYNLKDWIIFDPSIVRGLAYYTGIVWEAFDVNLKFRSIAGGGRYDELFSVFGAPAEIPCVGFGFGDCVILELLADLNLLPESSSSFVDVVVGVYNSSMYIFGVQVANKLRALNFSVDLILNEGKKKVANQYSIANKLGAKYFAFIAPNEWENHRSVRIKDLRSGDKTERTEKNIPFENLKDFETYFE